MVGVSGFYFANRTDCILCDPSIKKRFDGKYGGRRNLQEIPSSDYREPER